MAESQAATTARNALGVASDLGTVELKKETVKAPDVVKRIVVASKDYDLVALGANVPARREQFSLGSEQDQIIDQAESDVLIAIDHSAPDFESRSIRRILVPTNGMEYSLSGGDIAGALAAAYDASVTILHVVQPAATEQFAETEKEQLVESASPVAERLGFIIRRFGVRTHLKTRVANTPAEEIRRELDRRRYGLVVMGGIDRGRDNRLYLGHTIQSVLTDIEVPAVLLVAHEKPASTSPME